MLGTDEARDEPDPVGLPVAQEVVVRWLEPGPAHLHHELEADQRGVLVSVEEGRGGGHQRGAVFAGRGRV